MENMSIKTRYYITPSSLGSYFGVGFNSPEEQFLIDSGQEPNDFDEDAIRRMELGNHLEEGATNFFQDVIFKVPITDRNSEVKWGYDGKIKYAIDGMMELEGVKTVFENKISNSQSGRFTDNMTYLIQIHAYMLVEDVQQGVLAGIYQGRPIYKVIQRDEELIKDIKVMIEFVVNALNGLVDFYEEFPVDILDRYSINKLYEPIEDLSSITVNYLHELARLSEERKAIDKKIKELNAMHENDYEVSEGVYDDDVINLRVSKYERRGGFDVDLFKEDNPYLDLERYYKPNRTFTRRVLKLKEPTAM